VKDLARQIACTRAETIGPEMEFSVKSGPDVFLLNAFAEGYLARGKSFAPSKHQMLLAEDLANLPQFLAQPGDIVLLAKRPSPGFLQTLTQAGLPLPEFVELREGRIDPSLCRRKLGILRPWAWAPDSVQLLEPLFSRVAGETRVANQYFHDDIARLYSKAWSAVFLRRILARCLGEQRTSRCAAGLQRPLGAVPAGSWLCSEDEAGRAANTLEEALETIAAIRRRGHHRVVVKEAYGWAGQNTIRLWEPELLPFQRQWLTRALQHGREIVVEPWLEREWDFSVQLEMGRSGLQLCGYTGLINDRRGQFQANWAEADYRREFPAAVSGCFGSSADVAQRLHRLYNEIFSLLEAELRRVGFVGPVSIDAFIYRTPQGECQLKPIVEINPRYTMGRLTVELMKHACPGSCGVFRLITLGQARREGFADLSGYAGSLAERLPLRREGEPDPGIRQGTLCLNDPHRAQACLATFEVSPELRLPGRASPP
jgi:hypothetical protein